MSNRYFLLYLLCFLSLRSLAGPHDFSLEFLENQGQWDGPYRFRVNTPNANIFLDNKSFTYIIGANTNASKIDDYKHGRVSGPVLLDFHCFRVTFEGAKDAMIKGGKQLETYNNYYLGNDPKRWKTGIHPCKVVDYTGIYDGVDMHVAGAGANIKYEFIVAPGASTEQIRLRYDGTERMRIKDGNLIITTSLGNAVEMKPYTYQVVNGEQVEVSCKYKLDKNTLTYTFPKGYDRGLPLVIDPTVVFATFTGSTADNWGFTATYDAQGNFYAGGLVNDINFGGTFPVSPGAFQSTFGGGSTTTGSLYQADMGIMKFSADGANRIYATYLGGFDNDQPHSLIVDANDNLIIAGRTYSSNYPVLGTSYDPTYNGGADIVITKFNSTGTALLGSTFIGGPGDDGVNFIAEEFVTGNLKYNYGDDARSEVIIDNNNNIYVAACTQTNGFPTTSNAIQNSLSGPQDGVVFKLDPNATNLIWSTYIGGTSNDAAYVLALDPGQNNLYVGGGTQGSGFPFTLGTYLPTYQGGTADGFIAKFQNGGNYPLISATAIGTPNYDQVYGVQVDGAGMVYAMGQSLGGVFPVNNVSWSIPNSTQFVIKVDNNLTNNIYSTVFGSQNTPNFTNISPVAFLVDTCENVYVSGWGGVIGPGMQPTVGTTVGMPVTTDAAQSSTDGKDFYFIVLAKNITGLLYGTYMGQNNPNGEHVDGGTSRFDKNGVVYQAICGGCGGTGFPTTGGVWSPNNQSLNCNLAALKIRFDFAPVDAHAEILGDSTGCAPLTVNFQNASTNTLDFFWDFGDGSGQNTTNNPSHTFTSPGTYTVMLVAQNINACNQTSDTDFVTIVVDSGGIMADFSYVRIDTCDPFTATFTNTSQYSGNPGAELYTQFIWNFGDGSPTFTGTTPPIHSFPDTGSYTITLYMKDSTACYPYDTVTKVINFTTSRVTAKFTMPDSICIGTQFSFVNSSENANQYQWYFGDGDSSSTSVPVHNFDSIGTYTVMLISKNLQACDPIDTFIKSITILPAANADFIFSPVIPELNKPIQFTNQSTNAVSYLWTFGDGTTSTIEHPYHMYKRSGKYNVCLTAFSEWGCPDSICKKVSADIKPIIDVPTAFTPNGDGTNDVLYVRGAALETINFKIYNRWGELVFETSTLEQDPEGGGLRSQGWDGKLRGKEQEMDSYAFVLTATFIDGNTHEEKGNITLLR